MARVGCEGMWRELCPVVSPPGPYVLSHSSLTSVMAGLIVGVTGGTASPDPEETRMRACTVCHIRETADYPFPSADRDLCSHHTPSASGLSRVDRVVAAYETRIAAAATTDERERLYRALDAFLSR